MTIDYNKLSREVLDLDTQVRFAGVANNRGEMIASEYKENVEKLLVGDEFYMSIYYALQKRELYTPLAYKIGSEKSSITEYEQVTMISISINSYELFLISTEPKTDYLKIINFIHSSLDSQN